MLFTLTVNSDLKQQIAALSAGNDSFSDKVSQIVRATALTVLEGAKNLVPVSTGALSRSLMANFFDDGFSASVGSGLVYAARQEFDDTLDHSVRPPKIRVKNTKSGHAGTVIKGTQQVNPNATFGFLRKSLDDASVGFQSDLQALCDRFGGAFENGEDV